MNSKPKTAKQNAQSLIQAAKKGNLAEVQRLIPICEPSKKAALALSASVYYSHIECAKLLFEFLKHDQAIVNKTLEYAALGGSRELLEIFLPYADPKYNESAALWCAVQSEHIDCIRILIPISDVNLILNRLQDFPQPEKIEMIEHCMALEQRRMLDETVQHTQAFTSTPKKM